MIREARSRYSPLELPENGARWSWLITVWLRGQFLSLFLVQRFVSPNPPGTPFSVAYPTFNTLISSNAYNVWQVKELRQGAGAIASREGAPKWAEDTVEKLVEA